MNNRSLHALILLLVSGAFAPAQFEPPAAHQLDAATQKEIIARAEKLAGALAVLHKQGVRDPALADVEIYHKAAVWIVRHGEFYTADSGKQTLEVLDRGLLRAHQLGQGELPWLHLAGHETIRAYRSRVDGSLQPYAVSLPADYGKNPRQKWRLDVVLHGRDASLTEVKFLHQRHAGRATPMDQDFVKLDVFGRGNNAYRWAGETDVFEAIDHFLASERLLGRDAIDPLRIVLRGFSMGGAGTWHLGLHHPGNWCVLGPGAGFTSTHGYVKGLPPLPDYQEKCLKIYDAVEYTENAYNVPIVAYSGGDDPQKLAADNIEARAKQLGLALTHIVAPGLGHSFPPEWQKKVFAEYARHAAAGRPEYPDKVRFVTYTLKYPGCAWVQLQGLEKHYEQARVEAERTDAGYTLKTANVRVLQLALPPTASRPLVIQVDGQQIVTRPHESLLGGLSVSLEKRDGQWQVVLPQRLAVDQLRRPQKLTGLQGPIDDAFTAPFLCVRGTGKPWHDATQKAAQARLEQFAALWSKFLRGDLPVKNDVDVSDADMVDRHLILFGDPASNSLIAQVADRLPLQWTRDSITLAGRKVSAADHLPVLIYPSPLNSSKYVVLNSGHTFGVADFRGTNALLYPRLGDYALLKLAASNKDPLAVEVVTAGLFDDFWQVR